MGHGPSFERYRELQSYVGWNEADAGRIIAARAFRPSYPRPIRLLADRVGLGSVLGGRELLLSAAASAADRRENQRQHGDGANHASAAMISSGSGKRPSRCFENRTRPSITTSNCDRAPSTGCASCCVLPLISAARLAARRS